MQLENRERLSRNQTIRALLEALDLAAPGERAHAERVAVYACATGSQLGLSEEEILRLRYAALLHDVGKSKLDQKVLSKMGSLSDAEMLVIRRHAELSVQLVESFEFLLPAIPGIRFHHERWNGRGYPEGMVGEEIPIAAAIIGLCEAFDVMLHGAVWSSPRTRQSALEEIERGRGTEWSPEIVDAFFAAERIIQPVGSE